MECGCNYVQLALPLTAMTHTHKLLWTKNPRNQRHQSSSSWTNKNEWPIWHTMYPCLSNCVSNCFSSFMRMCKTWSIQNQFQYVAVINHWFQGWTSLLTKKKRKGCLPFGVAHTLRPLWDRRDSAPSNVVPRVTNRPLPARAEVLLVHFLSGNMAERKVE